MRLVSYNILNGGEGRADPLAEVILAQNPDIVVLVEADVPAVIDRIGSRLKMDGITGHGRRHGVAILSRWRIVESVNHSLLRDAFSDCLLEATVRQPDGNEWTVAAAHLHPHGREEDETRRETEIDGILDICAGHRAQGKPHLLAGDFNANSPIQQINSEKCKPRTRKDTEANGGTLPRRAIQKLLDAGYVDSLHAVRGQQAAELGSFSTRFPGQRVDYIFAHSIEVRRMSDARIEQDRLARYASDHFPAVLQID